MDLADEPHPLLKSSETWELLNPNPVPSSIPERPPPYFAVSDTEIQPVGRQPSYCVFSETSCPPPPSTTNCLAATKAFSRKCFLCAVTHASPLGMLLRGS